MSISVRNRFIRPGKRKANKHHSSEMAIDILHDVGLSRPEWKILENTQKRENKTKSLEIITCSVCVSDIGEKEGRYTTSCGHSFHLECILPWFERNTHCPNCRQKDIKNPISLHKK